MNEEALSSSINHASKFIRGLALLIDDLILITILYFIGGSVDESNVEQMMRAYNLSLLLVFLFLLLKDIIGRSPGKWLLGLRIVRKNELNRTPNMIVLALRNIPLLLGIIEPIVLLLNKNYQRIGDMIFGTYVISIRPKKVQISDKDLVDEQSDDTSQPSECISCGAIIPINESKCPKCGWSYKN